MDYAFLRQRGIRHLERLTGRRWTDFNAHDPGITILEQFCYALSDLAYRTDFALPDLLSREDEDAYASIHTPAEVLTIAPATLVDLRKLVTDVHGVKNAWIDLVDEPTATYDTVKQDLSPWVDSDAEEPPGGPDSRHSQVRVVGLYRVQIEKSDVIDVATGTIRREAAERLHRCRGLGQDIEAIEVLDHHPVRLGATLEIEAVDDASALLASVYERIEAYLSPAVPVLSLDAMRERGRRVDEIFEGPRLDHGFIDSEDLEKLERRRSVRISDLIREVMAVPGIVAVRHLQFLTYDGRMMADWLVEIPADETPRFDLSHSEITLLEQGLALDEFVHDTARAVYLERAKRRAGQRASPSAQHDLSPPPGRDRKVASYSSIQRQFPMVYGIGEAGLPGSATPARRAQAKQLKAYLLLYDQLLANHFAQLGNAGRLFSFHDETPEAYFSQPAEDVGALGPVAFPDRSPEERGRRLREMTEDPAQYRLREEAESGARASDEPRSEAGLRRRNRFLDHLLARFGEQLRDAALQAPADTDSTSDIMLGERLARLTERKRAFLRDYPRIGHDRGAGFNCLEPPGEDNRSGLERTLCAKLGIREPDERLYVVEHILLRPIAGDRHQSAPLLRVAPAWAGTAADPYSLQVSVVLPTKGRFQSQGFRDLVEQTILAECPAHLRVHVLWTEGTAMEAFESAFALWLERLRDHRRADFGLAP